MTADLTAAEAAYFQSGGEAEIPVETTEPTSESPAEPSVVTQTEAGTQEQPTKVEPDKFVPHGAFHEERERRKALDKQLQEERVRAARMEERLNIILQAQQKQQEVAPPSLDEDPIAYFKWKTEQSERQLGQIAQKTQEQERTQQQQAYQNQIASSYRAAAQEFATQKPDFTDAYQHLINTRISELREAGYTPEEAVQTANADEFAIVDRALREGRNPAEVAYKMAQARGYKPKAAQTGETDAQRLERIAEGQRESKSLSTAGGTAVAEPSIDALLSMDDSEFLKAVKSGQFKKVMGG